MIERSEESTFFQSKVVGDSKNFCPGEIYCRQLPEKQSASICRQVCWVKLQSDNRFEWKLFRTQNYRSIATESQFLGEHGCRQLAVQQSSRICSQSYRTKRRYDNFFKWKLLKTLDRNLPKPHAQVQHVPTITRKTVCFYLMSSLLNETPKRPSFWMKIFRMRI